jgi:hypothetical protein
VHHLLHGKDFTEFIDEETCIIADAIFRKVDIRYGGNMAILAANLHRPYDFRITGKGVLRCIEVPPFRILREELCQMHLRKKHELCSLIRCTLNAMERLCEVLF